MGVNWGLYEKLLRNGNGLAENKREVVIADAVNSFESGMVDDPAYQEIAVVNGDVTPLIASRSSVIQCDIKARPNTNIHIGDIVECYDEFWIVRELYIDKVGIINGIMWLCNEKLRFQDKSNEIHVRPCVVDDGTYSKRTGNPDARMMDNTYKMYASIDDKTKKLYVDKRISLGKIFNSEGEVVLEVYKIIGIDFKSNNFGSGSHLMTITLQRDVYNPSSDNVKLDICDVCEAKEEITTPESDGGASCIDGKDTIRLGTTRKYTASFIKASGEKDLEAVAKWDIVAPNGVTFISDDNVCSITVPLSEEVVGSDIVLSLIDEAGAYNAFEKKVKVIAIG